MKSALSLCPVFAGLLGEDYTSAITLIALMLRCAGLFLTQGKDISPMQA